MAQAKPTILLCLDEAEEFIKEARTRTLGERSALLSYRPGNAPDPSALAEAEGLCAWRVPDGMLARMPRLRWIHAMTAGVDHWLVRPDLPSGVVLTNARGTHSPQMAENILAAMFQVTKPFVRAAEQQARGEWRPLVPELLSGRTLGIVGLGAIGRELAEKARALGLRVIGSRRGNDPVPGVDALYEQSALGELFANADYLVLLAPLTDETRDLVGTALLARMKPTAWLLNFARGELVVDDELSAALDRGVLAGAVLDVFRTEPLPTGHRFWSHPRIVVLPHVGGRHPDKVRIGAERFCENLARFVEGRELLHSVDLARGY